jgi:hypothetical protein
MRAQKKYQKGKKLLPIKGIALARKINKKKELIQKN